MDDEIHLQCHWVTASVLISPVMSQTLNPHNPTNLMSWTHLRKENLQERSPFVLVLQEI